MGGVRKIIDGKDQHFWKLSGFLLMFKSITGNLFHDFTVTVGRGYFALNIQRAELAFIIKRIRLFIPSLRIYDINYFTFLQKDSVDTDIGLDFYSLIINKISFKHSLFYPIAINRSSEIGYGMRCGCGRQPYFYRIKMVEHFTPECGVG